MVRQGFRQGYLFEPTVSRFERRYKSLLDQACLSKSNRDRIFQREINTVNVDAARYAAHGALSYVFDNRDNITRANIGSEFLASMCVVCGEGIESQNLQQKLNHALSDCDSQRFPAQAIQNLAFVDARLAYLQKVRVVRDVKHHKLVPRFSQ